MSSVNLITGVAGFIGFELAKNLLQNNQKVIGIDNFLLGSKENIDNLNSMNGDFEFLEYDLSNYKNSNPTFQSAQKIDCLWHLAANSDISSSVDALEVDLYNTFFTTIKSGLLCEELEIKEFVFSSSSAVFGTVNNKIKENHGPLLPESYYGAMKLASEAYISSLSTYFIEKYTILRFPNVVGENTTHGIVYDFKKKLEKQPKFLDVLGDGSQKKPYLYIDDLITGMLYLKNVDSKNRIFNLSPLDDGISVKEIAEIAINILSKESIARFEKNSAGWPGDVVKYEYDTTKLISTGWKPKYSSREAIEKSFSAN
jgi:UDP-glucose 4-epimerase|tara:strand:+ start:1090 stop:2028 length:939 start_codon:yes stop_codon:yes gene_type:complete